MLYYKHKKFIIYLQAEYKPKAEKTIEELVAYNRKQRDRKRRAAARKKEVQEEMRRRELGNIM